MEQINLSRLKNLMKRAEAKEELTIGFLGGSITQGSLATVHKNTYAYRVFEWWEKTFPDTTFHYVNGGIGGTTSHFGVARAVTDVLMFFIIYSSFLTRFKYQHTRYIDPETNKKKTEDQYISRSYLL